MTYNKKYFLSIAAIGAELGAMSVVVVYARFGASQTDVFIYLVLIALLIATLCAFLYYRAQRKGEAKRAKRHTEVSAFAAYAENLEAKKEAKSKK